MASTILVGLDGSERSRDALSFGVWLAEAGDADLLTIAYVYRPGAYEDLMRDTLLDAEAQARKRLGERRVGFDAIESESPARGLHRLAERDEASVIVVGSSARGPIGRLLAGNVAERLLSGAPCSVAVPPAGYAERAGDRRGVIGVAYDGRPESRNALDAARELAERTDALVRIVGVVDADLVGAPLRETFERLLAEAKASLPDDVPAETAVLVGNTADVLAEEEVDALFCGSRGYGLIGQVLLGATSAALVRRAVSPVVVVPRTARRGLFARRAPAVQEQPAPA
jgi:nucleotide-binding universal stress UspA family protein